MIILCITTYNYVCVQFTRWENNISIYNYWKNKPIKSFANKELNTILLADVNTSVNNFSHDCK